MNEWRLLRDCLWTSFLARLHTVGKQHKGSWSFLSLAAFDGASVTYISKVTVEKVLNSPASLLFSPSQMDRAVTQETLPLHTPRPHNSWRLNPFTSASCLIHGPWGDAQYRALNFAVALVFWLYSWKTISGSFMCSHVILCSSKKVMKNVCIHFYPDWNAEDFEVPVARNLQWDTDLHQVTHNKDLSWKAKS